MLGAGAHLNGRPLRTSAKTSLDAAIAVTGQAEAGQDGTYRRIGESVTAMLGQALLVRAFVPSTFPMLLVATGQNDVFWQYEPVLPGVAAGANGPVSPTRRTVGLDASPRRLFPARVSRATVAAAMLDEAESPRYAGTIAIPLER
jgi:myo-inositol-1(or 4)-monophosphatase